jgi:hypothetical protein
MQRRARGRIEEFMTGQLVTVLALVALAAGAPGAAEQTAQPPPEANLRIEPDFFRTLVNPACSHCRDEAKRRAGELRDDDRVLAWTRGKYDGGAVPLRFFLAPYRVISDSYGVWVYDADAGFMRGYQPSYDFSFYGWRNGVMVIRHKDGTLFSALSGIAFDGPRKGERLKPLATVPSDWGYWLKTYPGTVAYHMFDKYQPVELPKRENSESIHTRITPDPRLPAEQEVVGLFLDGKTRAYPFSVLNKSSEIIEDHFADTDVVVLWHKSTHAAAAYAPEVEGSSPVQRLKLSIDRERSEAPFVDEQTGSHWGVEGRAVDGPLKGRTLRWLDSVQCKWFAWSAEYPRTDLYDQKTSESSRDGASPAQRISGVIARAKSVTPQKLAEWKRGGINAVAVVLDEEDKPQDFALAGKNTAQASMRLYYWVEVARNPKMAGEHPQWMASLGMHTDWQKRFPGARLPAKGEVAKAFPWVPITSRQGYDAHLDRLKTLLGRVPTIAYAGVLLNDLQGGPASCGCGNLLCRWATDYRVPSTATKLQGDDVAARFVAEVGRLIPQKSVIPIWTTECEDIDLPPKLAPHRKSTGLCGEVSCATTTCPKAFTKQWTALLSDNTEPVGVLALPQQLERSGTQANEPDFASMAVNYLDTVPPKNGGRAISHNRMWLIVPAIGPSATGQASNPRKAADLSPGAVFQCLVPIPQSYEPRLVSTVSGS